MPVCHPAPTCLEALAEATQLYPKRRRTSDGTCASSTHHKQNPDSDHEPTILVDGKYYESAFDLSHDPDSGCDAFTMAEQLRVNRDPRIKYVIAHNQMYSSYSGNGFKAWEWRPYHGVDPHTLHIHVSVLPDHIFDTGPWWATTKDDDVMNDGTRNRLIREWYVTYIGREPTASEQTWWRGVWYAKGVDGEDLVFAGIYDSKEAKAHRGEK